MDFKNILIALIALAVGAGAALAFTGSDSLGAISSPDVYHPLRVHGALTQGGAPTTFTATSTQSAYTLTHDDLINSSVIEIASVAAPALVLTLPATSTMETLLPNDGDMRTWYIDNQHAAATTTTITASQAIDLIGVTTNDDVIDGLEVSELTCWNKVTDEAPGFACKISELLKVD